LNGASSKRRQAWRLQGQSGDESPHSKGETARRADGGGRTVWRAVPTNGEERPAVGARGYNDERHVEDWHLVGNVFVSRVT